MTLDQINNCLKAATRSFQETNGVYIVPVTDQHEFAHLVATLVRQEMLAITRANLVLSNDAKELYKDLQAYDRFESGLNF
jgi:hypothetical protein